MATISNNNYVVTTSTNQNNEWISTGLTIEKNQFLEPTPLEVTVHDKLKKIKDGAFSNFFGRIVNKNHHKVEKINTLRLGCKIAAVILVISIIVAVILATGGLAAAPIIATLIEVASAALLISGGLGFESYNKKKQLESESKEMFNFLIENINVASSSGEVDPTVEQINLFKEDMLAEINSKQFSSLFICKDWINIFTLGLNESVNEKINRLNERQ